jgi:hypothetical protein
MTELNPYESPQIVDAPIRFRNREIPLTLLVRFIGWTAVYLLNLILPVLLGWAITNDEAKIGCLTTIVFFYGLGLWASLIKISYFKKLILGGFIVGVLQCCPILHLGFGVIANAIVESAGHATPAPPPTIQDGIREPSIVNSVIGGMMMTLLTGGPLILIAVVLGALFSGKSNRKTSNQ